MEWFANNFIQAIFIIGVVLLIFEVAVLGFSTFFLFFAGLAAIVSSILMWVGILPATFLYGIASIAVFTFIFALSLWKPMVRMQKTVDKTRASSDLIGYTFVLPEDIVAIAAINDKPLYQFSGVHWRLQSEADVSKGSLVEVSQTDVGVLWVKPKQKQV
jgi:hypothetical protein